MFLLLCFSATWEKMPFHSNNPWHLLLICLCYNLPKNVYFLFAAQLKITSAKEPSSTCHNNSGPDVHVYRTTDTPTNEFLKKNILFLKAFPHLFPLGKGMPFKRGILNDSLVHFLCQGHNQFAGDAAFISLLAISACIMKH